MTSPPEPSAPQPARPLRGATGAGTAFLCGLTCVAAVAALWFVATAGEPESRFISPATLPSPGETLEAVPGVFGERRLAANTLVTLRRVLLGFGLAGLVGVPLGVLAACFPAVRAFVAPRVAFVVSDTTAAVLEVPERYVDTARTLGASRLQIILKVLVPLAAPAVFNSLRLLFGIAFGYVMLAEVVKLGGDTGGLGDLINVSQRRGEREPILIVLVVIPLVAYAIDRALWWLQCDLFPHRYGGHGWLPKGLRRLLHGAGGAAEAAA